MRPRHHVAGERLATEKGQSSVYGAEKRSLHAAPLPICIGEGEDAEGGLLYETPKMGIGCGCRGRIGRFFTAKAMQDEQDDAQTTPESEGESGRHRKV
jgi:hypothetical protein